MQVGSLTFLGFFLNGAAGSGEYDDVTIEQVKRHINDGSIFEYRKTGWGTTSISASFLTPCFSSQ